MRDHDAASARVPLVAPCPKCRSSLKVRPRNLAEVDPSVQYWECEGCGFVWATRDGEDLRSIAADRSPRESA